jgi:hypothetical protein
MSRNIIFFQNNNTFTTSETERFSMHTNTEIGIFVSMPVIKNSTLGSTLRIFDKDFMYTVFV